MCFEVRRRDLLAKLGRITTKKGQVETPVLLPVINPAIQPISLQTLRTELGCNAVITNAYILQKQGLNEAEETDVHQLLDFDGVVMTDSGAYQILVYGDVDATPSEIVHYQERISTDIGTILDIPTSWRTTKAQAKQTVHETIQRAKQLEKSKTRDDILWVAPIQGGRYLDLVAYSAKQVGHLPFEIHGLGSPTTVMEQYRFDTLVDMILTAKMNMPAERPLHLFGAGHPFMFALAVALGCDSFDSAAYTLYAKQDRYMTAYGTHRLGSLSYFPCSCPICMKHKPKDVMQMPQRQKQEILAKHNLYASFAEVNHIKQTIVEGRLWEYLELRAHAHPALLQALKRLTKYQNYIERHSPVTKKSGLFFFNSIGLLRPEVVRHRKSLKTRYSVPKEGNILVLLPQPLKKPFHKAREIRKVVRRIKHVFSERHRQVHFCVYAAPFGVVPLELDEIYPLSQYEVAMPLDVETIDYVANQVYSYVAASTYTKVLLEEDVGVWKGRVSQALTRIQRKDLSTTILRVKEKIDNQVLTKIVDFLQELIV